MREKLAALSDSARLIWRKMNPEWKGGISVCACIIALALLAPPVLLFIAWWWRAWGF